MPKSVLLRHVRCDCYIWDNIITSSGHTGDTILADTVITIMTVQQGVHCGHTQFEDGIIWGQQGVGGDLVAVAPSPSIPVPDT